MAENLKSTKYADGTTIANITDNTVWANLDDNNTDKASCYYSLDYGYLYNYAAVTNGTPYDGTNNVQGVCPNGWHVPSDDEWKTLETYLGMSQTEADELGLRGTNEGGKLKETGTTHWNSPNTGATNESGFSALPGGYRKNSDGTNTDMGSLAVWWMPDEYSTNGAYYRSLSYDASTIYRQVGAKSSGASIRCVKD